MEMSQSQAAQFDPGLKEAVDVISTPNAKYCESAKRCRIHLHGQVYLPEHLETFCSAGDYRFKNGMMLKMNDEERKDSAGWRGALSKQWGYESMPSQTSVEKVNEIMELRGRPRRSRPSP